MSVDIKASPEEVFDFLADHRHVAPVFEGVSRWEPITPTATGVGARYQVQIVAVGVPLGGVVRLNQWKRPEVIGWTSESGMVKNDGDFTITKLKNGARLAVRVAYHPPASVIGLAIARRIDFVVKRRYERALMNIKEWLENERK